jgi:probable selenium-dependent hydroxylase accessory protein YqeC
LKLWEVCQLDPAQPLAIVGGGGKTTVLLELARQARAAGLKSGVVTTTTRMWLPSEPWLSLNGDSDGWKLSARRVDGMKALGLTGPQVDLLASERPGQPLLIEADGSRGRPLKVHGPDEPVVPSCARQTLALVGLSALGQVWSDAVVHRAELWPDDERSIDVDVLCRVLAKMLTRLSPTTVVLLNQVDQPHQLAAAHEVAASFPGLRVVARSHGWAQALH